MRTIAQRDATGEAPHQSGARAIGLHRPLGWLPAITVIVLAAVSSCSDDDGSPNAAVTLASVEPADPMMIDLAVGSGYGDPSVVSIPVPQTDAAASWLEGPGGAAVAMVDASRALWESGFLSCVAVADELDGIGRPEIIAQAAAATPDPATSEILVNLHGAVGHLLGACNEPTSFQAQVGAFAWQWGIADRRLQELGVTS